MPSLAESIEIFKTLLNSEQEYTQKARECKYEADLIWSLGNKKQLQQEEKQDLDDIGNMNLENTFVKHHTKAKVGRAKCLITK